MASPLVTLVDDGTVLGEWGNFAVDDEGNPPGRNVLIENGILTDYMWDWLRARKEGRKSSGNGRRQSYQHLPMVRMTNTYLLAGTEDPDEIVAQTPIGRLRQEARRRPGQHRHGRLRLRHHRGLPDRGRAHHRAAARRQPHRQRPRGAAADRRGGHRLRHDAGHLRQGRAERPGRLRAGHPAHHRRHARRDGVTTICSDLARSVVERARAGRGHRGLRDAGHRHRGPGLRRRGRVAHLGRFLRRRDPGPRRRARRRGQPGRLRLGRVARPGRHRRHAGRRPRQRPLRHARPRRRPGRARRRGRRGARPVGRRRRVDAHGEEGRAGARAGAGDTGRRPPGPAGLVGRLLGQSGGGGARLDDGHLVVPAAHQRLPLRGRHRRARVPTPRPAPGSASARAPGELVPDEAMDDAVTRATRMLGAQKAQSARCTVVFDPRVVSTLLVGRGLGAVRARPW